MKLGIIYQNNKIINLMMKSSDTNPYSGKLSEKDNCNQKTFNKSNYGRILQEGICYNLRIKNMELKFSKIKPFKKRKLDINEPVEVYRCLNRKGRVYSVRQKGKVIGHTTHLTLQNCKFVVNEAGRERCRRENQRNVHAFVKGYIAPKGVMGTGATLSDSTLDNIINYYPYEDLRFKKMNYGESERKEYVKEALGVIINENGISAKYVN